MSYRSAEQTLADLRLIAEQIEQNRQLYDAVAVAELHQIIDRRIAQLTRDLRPVQSLAEDEPFTCVKPLQIQSDWTKIYRDMQMRADLSQLGLLYLAAPLDAEGVFARVKCPVSLSQSPRASRPSRYERIPRILLCTQRAHRRDLHPKRETISFPLLLFPPGVLR